MRKKLLPLLTLLCAVWLGAVGSGFAQEEAESFDQRVDDILSVPADIMEKVVFWNVPIAGGIPMVLILLVAIWVVVY